MSTVESRTYLSPAFVKVTETEVEPTSVVTSDADSQEKRRQAWQDVIDHQLIEWGRDPESLADEGIEPPSREVIHLAIDFANKMKKEGLSPPDSVVPDPNGGIVFERREGGLSEVFHIWDDGAKEYRRFDGTRLTERRVW